MDNNKKENEINTKSNVTLIKYRCEKCQGILFMSSRKVSETIEIVCKTKHNRSKNSKNKTRCNHLNIIKGSKNV